MRNLTYLLSILSLTLPVLFDEWVIGKKVLRPYWRLLAVVSFIGLAYSLTEGFALRWLIWSDDPRQTLNIQIFGAQAETYLVNLLVFPVIAASTLLLIGHRQRARRKRR